MNALSDAESGGKSRGKRRFSMSQQQIVLALSAFMFLAFATTLDGFLDSANILALVQSVSILGILGVGMAVAVIGRGIDLAMVSVMSMSVAWVLSMLGQGTSVELSLLYGYLFVVVVGIIVGYLVAYAEIPALFTTLAMTSAVYGFVRVAFVDVDLASVPNSAQWLRSFGGGHLLGIPVPVIVFGVVSLLVHMFLRYTIFGVYIRGMGDNPRKARISGFPVRPMILVQFVISASIAFLAGLVLASLVGTMNTRLVNSTMVYDVILVVVLGGVVLSGGKGGVSNVIVGTLLIGIFLNAMTIMNIPYLYQNLIKGGLLLLAIIIDTILNPRDEQTSQQGDI
jgi:ribose transport system permease protein